jgi:flagellar biogenesis protein FliO
MIVIACGGLIAALFVVLFRAWFVKRDGGGNAMAGTSSDESPLST